MTMLASEHYRPNRDGSVPQFRRDAWFHARELCSFLHAQHRADVDGCGWASIVGFADLGFPTNGRQPLGCRSQANYRSRRNTSAALGSPCSCACLLFGCLPKRSHGPFEPEQRCLHEDGKRRGDNKTLARVSRGHRNIRHLSSLLRKTK